MSFYKRSIGGIDVEIYGGNNLVECEDGYEVRVQNVDNLGTYVMSHCNGTEDLNMEFWRRIYGTCFSRGLRKFILEMIGKEKFIITFEL